MQLKLLTSRAGDNFAQSRGDEIEVDSEEGCRMIAAGQGAPVGPESKAEYEAWKKTQPKPASVVKRQGQAAKPQSPRLPEEDSPTVDELGLKVNHAKALRNSGIVTLEDLQGADLTSVKGITEAAAAEIREHVTAYLSR